MPPFLFQLPTDVQFTYCRICGAYFAHPLPNERRRWSFQHADTHSRKQHHLLKVSGLWLMPDAAFKLATIGVLPLKDLVMDDEVEHAMLESKPFGSRPPPVRST